MTDEQIEEFREKYDFNKIALVNGEFYLPLEEVMKKIDNIVEKLEEERDRTYFVETSRPQEQYVYGNRDRDLFNKSIDIVKGGTNNAR